MLTRIEVDGFKNLLGFSAEFGPFTCIAGPNAVGKSNLFDAIEFLSLLAQYSLEDAASRVRATPGSYESARTLFWNDGEVWIERIRITVEMIVDGWVTDDLGRGERPSSAAFRYEIELRFDGRLQLAGERLTALGSVDSPILHFPHHPSFAEAHRLDGARASEVVFDIAAGVMPDGGAAPNLSRAETTVLQLYKTIDHPEILAVRDEIRSWQRLALNPLDLRKPHEIGSARRFGASGEHLPLLFMQLLEPDYPLVWADPEELRLNAISLSAEIVANLGRIAPLRDVRVEEDTNRELLTIRAKLRSGEQISARAMSEGTLRCLALVLLGVRSGDQVLCIEEPENGLHPRQFGELAQILFDLAVDPEADVSEEWRACPQHQALPLRQAIVNTHSPNLIKQIFSSRRGDLLMATSAAIAGPQERDARVLRLHPIRETWRCRDGVDGVMLPIVPYVGSAAMKTSTVGAASAAEDG